MPVKKISTPVRQNKTSTLSRSSKVSTVSKSPKASLASRSTKVSTVSKTSKSSSISKSPKISPISKSRKVSTIPKPTKKPNQLDELTFSEKTPLKLYLNDIGKYPLLSAKEELALAKRIQKGDKKAKEQMINSNLRLVVRIAQDYNNYGLPLLDLISEGNIGLIKAIERFEPTRGGKLSTYAAWWIKQSIKRALANQSKTIRLPVHLIEKISRLRRIENEMKDKHKRDITNEELADMLNLPINKVAHLKAISIRPASLNTIVGQDDNTELGELIGDDNIETPSDKLLNRTQVIDIKRILKSLDHRDAQIIIMRFGLDDQRCKTLEEVGEALGITRERVRQLQYIILKNIKNILLDQERQRTQDEIKVESIERRRAQTINEFILNQQQFKNNEIN
ncbi:MAG: RpoD family RNA polymerase sigma factor [Verrucomicrobia bacterium]|nr:MAG: RpoD family RNA polymerase sigma factor [Verrucomicrobiota bacterium]